VNRATSALGPDWNRPLRETGDCVLICAGDDTAHARSEKEKRAAAAGGWGMTQKHAEKDEDTPNEGNAELHSAVSPICNRHHPQSRAAHSRLTLPRAQSEMLESNAEGAEHAETAEEDDDTPNGGNAELHSAVSPICNRHRSQSRAAHSRLTLPRAQRLGTRRKSSQRRFPTRPITRTPQSQPPRLTSRAF
jgi:hypothetical protein